MLHALGRLFMVAIGYGIAAFAASAVVVFALQGMPAWQVMEAGTPVLYGIAMIGGAFYAMFLMSPSLIVIAITEAFALRQWWLYLLVGLAGGLLVDANWWRFLRGSGLRIWHDVEGVLEVAQVDASASIQTFFDEARTTPTLLAAGAAAGLTYWLIAGRRAGFTRDTASLR